MTRMTDAQKQVLTHIARRLRKQAAELERVARSGDADLLEKFCGMLHATGTQLAWTKGTMGGNKPS
jgi:hypothetical protein